MRVVFFGTAEFAVPSLEALVARGHAVVRCVTQPDRPQGRGLRLEPSPVKQVALRLRVPLLQPERLSASALEDVQADVGVAVAYGQLIRRDVLSRPAHGVLGIHPSLLPKYRGAAPVAWALLNGDTVTGMTIFRLNERLDAGEILVQEHLAIEPHEPADALTRRLAALGAQCLLRALELIEGGAAAYAPQDEAQATSAPKLTKTQGRIDWSAPAEAIERIVRATIPWPGASTAWRGEPLKIWSAAAGRAGQPAPPGTVVSTDGGLLAVSAGQGVLQIAEVQPPGGRRMTVKEFLAGHPVKEGERFA